MVLQDLLHICEHWAPPQLAWERDNVGLQAGARTQRIRKVLVTLDVTDTVIDEAQRKRVDLLISHHPLIFEPLRSICRDERTGRLLAKLVKAGIALYVLHTNLDFTRGGVSFSLAEKLSLQEVKVLHPESRRLKKIVVYTPESHAARLTAAMAGEGAGVIGSYDFCSFRAKGIGTFRPGKGADPYLGKIGRIE
jgi:dinuclear metal center YbgI/SA1388 family protein